MATKVNRGLAWIGVASSLVSLLDLAALLIVLRYWVNETDYGIATKCVWVLPILDQATELSAPVVQRDDLSDSKISSVFWINLGLGMAVFGLILFGAPILAREFYGHAVVGTMLIVYGTKLIFQNVYLIPIALMKRELRFKELSVIRIIANLAEFVGKVGFAAAGFGIWCFVLGPMCRVLVTGIGAQICHPWRPKLTLRFREAKDYVMFGLKTSGSQILFSFYTSVDYPIVGYYFGDDALGFYRIAFEIVLEPVRMISNVIVDIAFPAFARLRHQHDRLIAQFVSFTKLNLITVMTYSAIVLVASEDVIAVIFPKFTGAATAVRVLCIVAVLRSVSFMIPPLLDGMGHPHRTFTYTLSAAITLPISFVLGSILLGDYFGFLSVAIAWSVGYPIAFAILMYLAIYTLNWSTMAYLRAISGVAVCMIAAGVAGLGVHRLFTGQAPWIRLLVTTIAVVGVTGVLLAYTQGLSLRGAARALKGDPPEPGAAGVD
jgi:PST family polysaccharide transporter